MNPLPVTLACAGAVTVLSANLYGCRDNLRVWAGDRKSRPAAGDGPVIFDRVVVLMDLSACAGRTVELIARIPGIGEAVLLDVMDAATASGAAWLTGQSRYTPRANTMMRLVAQKNYLESLGTRARVALELSEGSDVCGTLMGVASREDASLILMRSEKASWLLSSFVENLATRALRHCTRRDMLLYPASTEEKYSESLKIPPVRDMFARVLCPTDLSSLSMETILWAAELDTVREIVLLHVVHGRRPGGEEAIPSDIGRNLDEMKNLMGRKDLTITTIVREGDPAEEIGRVAEEQDVSLILMSRCGIARYVKGAGLGTTVAGVAHRLNRPLLARRPRVRLDLEAHELSREEFDLAEDIWTHYRHQKADRENDRIFGVFLEKQLVSTAWCKRHPDGLEVDGVFTLEEFRRNEFARRAVATLIAACGHEPLYMHATLELVDFYTSMGFVPIPEDDLPPTIRERFAFALGNLEGANACPMRRDPA